MYIYLGLLQTVRQKSLLQKYGGCLYSCCATENRARITVRNLMEYHCRNRRALKDQHGHKNKKHGLEQ